MTEPQTTAAAETEQWLRRAAKLRRTNDATTAALVGIGHALRVLGGADYPPRWITSHGYTAESATPAPTTRHSADVCGWDFDALADITRAADSVHQTKAAAEMLYEWFDAHGLDVDELGGRP